MRRTVDSESVGFESEPGRPGIALFVQGSIYERQKKYDQAEQMFKKVLSVDPLNSSASNYLGYMLADRGIRLEDRSSISRRPWNSIRTTLHPRQPGLGLF